MVQQILYVFVLFVNNDSGEKLFYSNNDQFLKVSTILY